MKKNIIIGMGLLSALFVSANIQAALVGQIAVSLKVEEGCSVNNGGVTGNLNTFGSLNFGQTASTWTNILTSQVVATGSSGGDLTVVCSTGVSKFGLTIDNGLNGDTNTRKMKFGSSTIDYNIYKDAARSIVYPTNSQDITLSNNTATIPIYGAVPPNAATAKVAGTYTDTLSVTLTF